MLKLLETFWRELAMAAMAAVIYFQHGQIREAEDDALRFQTKIEATRIADAKSKKLEKERKDARVKSAAARVHADAGRVRDAIGAESLVRPGPEAGGADTVTFDRAELARILDEFAKRATDLVAKGGEAQSAIDILREP